MTLSFEDLFYSHLVGVTCEVGGQDAVMPASTITLLATTDDDVEDFRRAVRKGRLFDVQTWISDGKPLFQRDGRRKHALEIAVETGFHSMVQVLAEVWPDRDTLNEALQQAAWKRRPDLVWLLLEHGADMTAVSLESIAQCYDRDLLQHFLDHWDEVGGEDGLTELVLAKVRPFIGIIKEFAPCVPNHKVQLGAALNQFISEGKLKWCSLAMWMGADPRLPAPVSYSDWSDPDEWTTPVKHAMWRGNIDALKLMKLSPDTDDLNSLLESPYFRLHDSAGITEYLVERGADINNKPNGGSSIVDALLHPIPRIGSFNSRCRLSVWALEEWVDRGARLVAEDTYDFREARRCLYSLCEHDVRHAIAVLSRATDEETLIEYVNTDKIRRMLGFKGSTLRKHIHSLYHRAAERKRLASETPEWATMTAFEQAEPRINVTHFASLTRNQLYDALWSLPAAQVKEELGISDLWLRKVCALYRIPRPDSWYWSKLERGERPSRKPLDDEGENPQIDALHFGGVPPLPDGAIQVELEDLIERLSAPGLSVHLTADLRSIYEEEAISSFDQTDPPGRRYDAAGNPRQMDRRTVEALQARAKRAHEMLVAFLGPYGFKLTRTTDWRGTSRPALKIYGEAEPFAIEREGRKLTMERFGQTRSVRMKWFDGRRHYLESFFAEFGCVVAYCAAAQKCEKTFQAD